MSLDIASCIFSAMKRDNRQLGQPTPEFAEPPRIGGSAMQIKALLAI